MAEQSGKEFQIGLAMAGAISAGAYTAGVLDFLFQALDEWEKDRGEPGVPDHRVGIKVLSGASAGAICGALGVIALAGGLRHRPFPAAASGRAAQPGTHARPGMQPYQCALPGLYDSWVVRPRMVAQDGGRDLLGSDDLDAGAKVTSLLNGALLDEIRDSTLRVPEAGPTLPYVAENLHVYLSVANLRGVPYAIPFAGGSYGMQSHGDRAHFVVQGLGTWRTESPWADSDSGTSIAVSGLTEAGAPSRDWRDYAEAAVASGAFPVGLPPRTLSAPLSAYAGRKWPLDVAQLRRVEPDWPADWKATASAYAYLNVDGGLINNEPFEYARFALRAIPTRRNERTGDKADRAVIMIDPFPEAPPFLADGKPAADLASVILALLPAMKNQARFKPGEVVAAADESVFSRFMIAPHRQLPEKEREELYAMASGLLGGFGGFLSEPFRAHDFQLGRRNCQRFLQDSFSLPASNEIVASWPEAARNDPRFSAPDAQGAMFHSIVPLLGSAAAEVELPAWPRLAQADFDLLQERIEQRIKKLAPALIEQQTEGRMLRGALKLATAVGRPRMLRFVRDAVLSDLIRRDQMAGWEIPGTWQGLPPDLDPQAIRSVLAALAKPGMDYRTVGGIVRETKLDAATVGRVLDLAEAQRGRPYRVHREPKADEAGNALYTLASYRPGWFQRTFGKPSADADGPGEPRVD